MEIVGGSASGGGADVSSSCPDLLLHQGTKQQLCEEIVRRGVMDANVAATCTKQVLQRMLRMSTELEEKEQELTLTKKRSDAASPATHSPPSKRAAAAAAEEEAVSPSSASSPSMLCSEHCGEVSKAYCRQCARLVCYKCLLGSCRAHSERAVDVENVARNHTQALLDECDRVQQAFHDSLKRMAEAQAAAATADIHRIAAELQQQLQKTAEAQIAAATADIDGTVASLLKQGDAVIDTERQLVRSSLDRVQAQVQEALPRSDDLGALVEFLCSGCTPWFRVDVEEHPLRERTLEPYMSAESADSHRNATDAYFKCNLPVRNHIMSKTDIPASQSLLLSVSQPLESSPSVGIQVIMHHMNGSIDRLFSLQSSASTTFGQLKDMIQLRTSILRHRLVLIPYCALYRSDDDPLSNMIRDGWSGDYKVHVFLDKAPGQKSIQVE